MTDYMHQYKRSKKPSKKTGKGTSQPGEIWCAENLDGIKDRPILVLKYSSGTVTYRKCTSQSSTVRNRDTIEDYLEAGLDKETFVDPEIRNTSRTRLVRKLGALTEYDRQKFGL